MESYKTYKGTEKGKVGAFKNQYGDITVEITLSKTYSLEYYSEESEDERKDDFYAEYGFTDESLKAINMINEYIQSNF
jgi:hypothetical protein